MNNKYMMGLMTGFLLGAATVASAELMERPVRLKWTDMSVPLGSGMVKQRAVIAEDVALEYTKNSAIEQYTFETNKSCSCSIFVPHRAGVSVGFAWPDSPVILDLTRPAGKTGNAKVKAVHKEVAVPTQVEMR